MFFRHWPGVNEDVKPFLIVRKLCPSFGKIKKCKLTLIPEQPPRAVSWHRSPIGAVPIFRTVVRIPKVPVLLADEHFTWGHYAN